MLSKSYDTFVALPFIAIGGMYAAHRLYKRYTYSKLCTLDDMYLAKVNPRLSRFIYRILFVSLFIPPLFFLLSGY